MQCPCYSVVRIVIDQCFGAKGYKRYFVVVKRALKVFIGGDCWVAAGGAKHVE